jgi:hypothetical protein
VFAVSNAVKTVFSPLTNVASSTFEVITGPNIYMLGHYKSQFLNGIVNGEAVQREVKEWESIEPAGSTLAFITAKIPLSKLDIVRDAGVVMTNFAKTAPQIGYLLNTDFFDNHHLALNIVSAIGLNLANLGSANPFMYVRYFLATHAMQVAAHVALPIIYLFHCFRH